ncbi:MAG: hypothetical protein LBT95_02110 [Treponema sp.]|jgi:hypothetical protein|nr:hypothetical protein [Treponema sp.]
MAALFSKTNPAAVYIAGIKYRSLFDADLDSGIRSVSIWKALKKTGGGPVMIRGEMVVLETWINTRLEIIRKEYAL